jgi:membrane carboxypeptidase/penicillin-binding protein PbpC
MVLDIPQQFSGTAPGLIYVPGNRDGVYRGPMNLRDAMSAWLLSPAVEVANRARLDSVITIAHRLGVNSLTDGGYDLSLLERGGAISTLDVAYAYSVFAAMGEMRGLPTAPLGRDFRVYNPTAVLRIEDAEGNVLWSRDGAGIQPIVVTDSALVYLINDVLADAASRRATLTSIDDSAIRVTDPSGRERTTAIVSGVTSNNRDAWTAGYTPQFVVAVRVGREDSGEMLLDAQGFNGAAPIWRAVMQYAHNRDNLDIREWTRPEAVIVRNVCDTSGLSPNGVCPTYDDVFLTGQPPAQDTFWQNVAINSLTGNRATASTPAGQRTERIYFVPPSAALDWWQQRNLPLPPEELDPITTANVQSANLILRPEALQFVGGVVEIRGTVDVANMESYQLSYGQSLDPQQWFSISDPQTAYTPGGLLGTWNTAGLDGVYTLRLTVRLRDSQVEESTVFVTVDNQPPTVTLGAGVDDAGNPRVYRFPGDVAVTLEADVLDNAIDRVEFYANGEFLSVDNEWPFSADWQITRAGAQIFTAVAFDTAGNSQSADLLVDIAR